MSTVEIDDPKYNIFLLKIRIMVLQNVIPSREPALRGLEERSNMDQKATVGGYHNPKQYSGAAIDASKGFQEVEHEI